MAIKQGKCKVSNPTFLRRSTRSILLGFVETDRRVPVILLGSTANKDGGFSEVLEFIGSENVQVFFPPHKSSRGDTKKTPWTDCVCVCVRMCVITRIAHKNEKWQLIWTDSCVELPTMPGRESRKSSVFTFGKKKVWVSQEESRARVILKGPCPGDPACWA